MEKEVLYIEQGDDITDVILGISDSSAKIIAIVPPKDSDIFYDIKDVKLIHKTSLKTKKNLVLVTTDKTIINNAAEVQVPVTKDLKSAPSIPTKLNDDQPTADPTKPADKLKNDDPFVAAKEAKEAKTAEATISIKDNTVEKPEDKPEVAELSSILRKPHIAFLNKFKKSNNDDVVIKTNQDDSLAAKSGSGDIEDGVEDDIEDDSENNYKEDKNTANNSGDEDESDITSIYRNSERSLKHTEKNHSNNAFVAWLGDHARLLIASAVVIVILVIASFWLFVISPAVKITVYLRTSTSNFSEVISLITDETKEKLDEGVFSLIKHSVENESKVEFEATGQKNNGEKATGSVVVSKNMGTATNPISSFEIPAGTTFTYSGKSFTSNSNETLTWDGNTLSDCSNAGTSSITTGCVIEKTIAVTATEAGTAYNVAASAAGWTSSKPGISVKSTTNFTGGTDDIKTIVTQKDINDARTKFKVNISADADMKAKFKLEIPESEELVIDASFSQYSEEPVSSVAVGEEPKSGEKPTLTVKTVALIYTINLDKLKQFITAKAKVADNNYIYSLGNPFIENFLARDEAKTEFTGKLKTSYTVGINLTEQYIIDNVKGKLVGEVKPFLTSAGANRVEIETSHSLVNSVPNDVNKISIEIITD